MVEVSSKEEDAADYHGEIQIHSYVWIYHITEVGGQTIFTLHTLQSWSHVGCSWPQAETACLLNLLQLTDVIKDQSEIQPGTKIQPSKHLIDSEVMRWQAWQFIIVCNINYTHTVEYSESDFLLAP